MKKARSVFPPVCDPPVAHHWAISAQVREHPCNSTSEQVPDRPSTTVQKDPYLRESATTGKSSDWYRAPNARLDPVAHVLPSGDAPRSPFRTAPPLRHGASAEYCWNRIRPECRYQNGTIAHHRHRVHAQGLTTLESDPHQSTWVLAFWTCNERKDSKHDYEKTAAPLREAAVRLATYSLNSVALIRMRGGYQLGSRKDRHQQPRCSRRCWRN